MAKKEHPKRAPEKGKDAASGLRLGTKKFCTYEAWKAGKSEEDCTNDALNFQGNTNVEGTCSTTNSVKAWRKEFDRRWKPKPA